MFQWTKREPRPLRAWDENDVEVGRVATVGEGADFGEEAGDNMVEASVAPGFRR